MLVVGYLLCVVVVYVTFIAIILGIGVGCYNYAGFL